MGGNSATCTLQALQVDMEQGHIYLKTMREKTKQAMAFLEEPEAEQLKEEVDTRLLQLKQLMEALRAEQSSLEKCISLSKDFMDKYKAQAQWLMETKNLLASSVEPKAELYQKKAQLAKYKVTYHWFIFFSSLSKKKVQVKCFALFLYVQTIQQTVQSHESALKSVFEKGQALLDTVHDTTIGDNMKKMQTDYQDLCLAAKV